jgi:hypothetical protein
MILGQMPRYMGKGNNAFNWQMHHGNFADFSILQVSIWQALFTFGLP